MSDIDRRGFLGMLGAIAAFCAGSPKSSAELLVAPKAILAKPAGKLVHWVCSAFAESDVVGFVKFGGEEVKLNGGFKLTPGCEYHFEFLAPEDTEVFFRGGTVQFLVMPAVNRCES